MDAREVIRGTINQAADYLHDATRWDQQDEADDQGKTPMDRLVDRIEAVYANEIRTLRESLRLCEYECGQLEDAVEGLRAENERLRDALDDIECDYNINEGSEGIPITPGHKRCVDRAVAALRGE